MIFSVDPRTGVAVESVVEETSTEQVRRQCEAALAAGDALERLGRRGRALLLHSMASSLESDRAAIVAIADRETALGTSRLSAELTRTCYQLRLFAEVVSEGSYLEVTIDHAAETAMGPRPDLRRMLRPIGPVAVFGASNFPLAFSIPGGDTASAIAAGCPVVAKAHDAHPATSLLCAQRLAEGAAEAGVEVPVVSLVFGLDAGVDLVSNPNIRAVGFTGSLSGGRYLQDLAKSRDVPIPFYGELGALNAVVILPDAARRAGVESARGLATSSSLGVGQFCTKPGLVFLPFGDDGDAIITEMTSVVRGYSSSVMLSAQVAENYATKSSALRNSSGVRVLATGRVDKASGNSGLPTLLLAEPDAVTGALLDECFGPVIVVARYGSAPELRELVERLQPALTATLHAADADASLASEMLERLSTKVGRVIWNGYPTGVAVSWAMHHGGPFPAATDALHTSVGATAIRRWLRPICYQDTPAELLPAELADEPPAGFSVPRRVDGRFVLPPN